MAFFNEQVGLDKTSGEIPNRFSSHQYHPGFTCSKILLKSSSFNPGKVLIDRAGLQVNPGKPVKTCFEIFHHTKHSLSEFFNVQART